MSEIQERPLVTFALFAYNQERFVREAVEAALNQEYERLEIILSDDCSTDSTFEIINSVASNYSGRHKVITNRNPVNLGLAKHFSSVVTMARGEIIVVAAGDDISLSRRVSKTVELLASDPDANIVSFTDVVINEDGNIRGKPLAVVNREIRKVTLQDYCEGHCPPLSGASRGYRKTIFNIFGDLNAECPTEDTPSILRSLMLGHALVSSECGIFYRQHSNNLSGSSSIYLMKFEEIKKQYLRDAEFAVTTGLISEETMGRIIIWVEANFRKRMLAKGFHENKYKGMFFLKRILLNKDYKMREKIIMVRTILQSKRLA